jgi:hypothetical protein
VKPEAKRPLGRPRHRWVDNIKIDLLEMVSGDFDWACSTNGSELECLYVGGKKPKGNRPLGRPRRSWVDNIKIDLLEIGCCDVGWACSTNEGE